MEEPKKPLDLDWDMVLGKTEEDPPELVIERKTSAAVVDLLQRDDHIGWTDRQLEEEIIRKERTLRSFGPKMNDRGDKLRLLIISLEQELQRRKLNPTVMEINEPEKPARSASLDRQDSDCTISEASQKSCFGAVFSRKLEEKTDSKSVNAFDKELSIIEHCIGQKVKNGDTSQRRKLKSRAKSRPQPFQCARNLSRSADNHQKGPKGRVASNDQFQKTQQSLSKKLTNINWDWEPQSTNGAIRRKGKAYVLVDEDDFVDEDDIKDLEMMGREEKLSECMKDAKIFYPSSDDPESVEICYADIKCLDAESFLKSPVINFYIRYLRLQASSTERISEFHFFNTFFYEKLKQAVSFKGSDKETNFSKFRRWWKDVNLFQKSYILIPIHEDVHWSLVIICIPNKEYGSGPIVLHLDSLGFHYSKSIFENIKSYLTAEWNYLRKQDAPLDLPIPERIWENLPRRIDEKRVEVPQQKNDYDCGPFMLFFMERFVNDAPERLKREDLDMFSKQWFSPQEASGLRIKIRRLLLDKFEEAKRVKESSSSDDP